MSSNKVVFMASDSLGPVSLYISCDKDEVAPGVTKVELTTYLSSEKYQLRTSNEW